MSRNPYHPSVQAIMEGYHGEQQPVNENGDAVAAKRDEPKNPGVELEKSNRAGKKAAADRLKKRSGLTGGVGKPSDKASRTPRDYGNVEEGENGTEVLIAEWQEVVEDAIPDGHVIVEGDIDGIPHLMQIAEDVLPDPVIQLSVNQFLVLSEDEESYGLITVPISESIGSAIMSGLRSVGKFIKGAWNTLADKLGGAFGKKDNRSMLKNYARMYRQDPEKLREIMHEQNLEAAGGDEEKAKAATDRQLNQFSRFNAVREGSRRMAADFRQARENGTQPSADSMNYAKGVARAIATAKETAEREGISPEEAMQKVQGGRMGNVLVTMAANHPDASDSVRQEGQRVAQADPESSQTGVQATGGSDNMQQEEQPPAEGGQGTEPEATPPAEPAAETPPADGQQPQGEQQPPAETPPADGQQPATNQQPPAETPPAQGEAPADGQQPPAQTPAAEEPPAPVNPAPSAEQKKAMRQQAMPSRGQQNMQIARRSRYTMTIKGNKQTGFDEQGKPQYQQTTVNVPVNGMGLAAAIQNYMAGGTISAGAKHGHITPVQVQVKDPKSGRKMTISTPRTSVQGQGQGQTGPAYNRGNVQTTEANPFVQARARRTAATQGGAQQ